MNDTVLERVRAQIPTMSREQRETLASNCKRQLNHRNAEHRQSAEAILKLLQTVPASAGRHTPPVATNQRTMASASHRGAPCRGFTPDAVYEHLCEVAATLTALDRGDPVLLAHGRAGTGKTKLVQYLGQRLGNTLAVVDPTGIAAQNANAQTIHSLFQLPVGVLNYNRLPALRFADSVLENMATLIIDEISMVRADLLDSIDTRLRTVRHSRAPFGGVQVIAIGDFLQLPPVVTDDDRPALQKLGYEGPFAFHAKVLRRVSMTRISLATVYRQTDVEFIRILGNVRTGRNLGPTMEWINARCVGPHRPGVTPLLLTATRSIADKYNQRGIENLGGKVTAFSSKAEGNTAGLEVPQKIELKPGARVMATRNDPDRRWVNGSMGTVTRIVGRDVFVMFDGSDVQHHVDPVRWEKIKHVWNAGRGQIEKQVIGAIEQLPLALAWAITIHKSQGMKLDDVRIDFGGGAFASGQVYVALSRVKTVEGLSLTRPLRPADISVDPQLQLFLGVHG